MRSDPAPPLSDPGDLHLVPTRAEDAEEPAKKSDLQNLLREKLYLQARRRSKYAACRSPPVELSAPLLRALLRDCDATSPNFEPSGAECALKVEALRGEASMRKALRKWQLDPEKSKGTLQIPGLLAVTHAKDFELLESVAEKKPRGKKRVLRKEAFLGEAYRPRADRLPRVSAKFESIDFGDASFEIEMRTNKSKSSKYRSDRRANKEASKAKKSELQLVRTARMNHFDRKRVKVARNECFAEFSQIERKISEKRQKALMRISSLKEAELAAHKRNAVVKSWARVSAAVVKIQKFFQRDSEQNAKKLALLCAKERRKMLAKTKKNVKDYVLRAKRLNKEVLVYWKRRGKELSDLKKKREKIRLELRKKEEERREQRKQKRKIEYLIKQSDIYAHIMAEKLGIKERKAVATKPSQSLLTHEDVAKARASVDGLIRKNQARVNSFEREVNGLAPLDDPVPAPHTNGNEANIDFDFSKINLDEKSSLISTPQMFQGELKEYQLKGLRWLNNLFEQGINGILADEMGLGKTVQAIALITHVAEKKNCWGPFLVIAPTITLFNWQSECAKFSPRLKVLPYWGPKKDREILRKSFRQKYFGSEESSSHVVITSYSFAVRDFKYLDRLKWQYIILDEAQAIKNIRSQRWSTLLSLKSRNKLLLTGTPIQNTMAELWALLHFIMPQLFDSHEEFQEWFSKDIEAHSKNKQGYLNKTQLNRLHAILKPFMLRRVKKDVEKEIGKKIVTELICEMSARQKLLYNNIKKRICLSDLMQMYENKQKTQNLMNLVMQFRKVALQGLQPPRAFRTQNRKNAFDFFEHARKQPAFHLQPQAKHAVSRAQRPRTPLSSAHSALRARAL